MRRMRAGRSRSRARSRITAQEFAASASRRSSGRARRAAAARAPLRKSIVKPNVRPKPGSTLGWRQARHGGIIRLAGRRPAPASAAGSPGAPGSARRCPEICEMPRIRIWSGDLGEAPRERIGDVAEAQLGAHLQSMHGLRLGARIEERPHALRALAVGRTAGQDADVDAFGGHVPQQTRRDRKGRRARRLIGPVNEHALRRARHRRQNEHFLRAVAQQPLDLRRPSRSSAAMTAAPGSSGRASSTRPTRGSSCAWRAPDSSGWRLNCGGSPPLVRVGGET